MTDLLTHAHTWKKLGMTETEWIDYVVYLVGFLALGTVEQLTDVPFIAQLVWGEKQGSLN